MSTPRLPGRLAAPAPTWEREVDVVVVGSGAAGLAAALAARPVRSVLIVTKGTLDAGSTAWAQGGLAAVLDPDDSFDHHVHDTLEAGAGLCDEAAVRELVAEAPTAIRYLARLGAAFDPDADRTDGATGAREPALTREGGHSHNRIVHAGGDRSGAELQRTLDESAMAAGVDVLERAFALDLVVGATAAGERRAAGVTVAALDRGGGISSVGTIRARATVLATGGWGHVFASTSNPPAVTGDGVAMALRAGLAVRDVEFVQFHPTVLWTGHGAIGQQTLISEAVRGEGAVLYDAAGARVMNGVHPAEDLAPRDVVAAAITARMMTGAGGVGDHVFLDATHLGDRFPARFPTITAACRDLGVDPARERIPVAPAAHYSCGGVPATLDGATELPGLYAVGEVACTGVHGANRLASNSLTEGVVVGTRLGRRLAWELPDAVVELEPPTPAGLLGSTARVPVQAAMARHVGVLRSAESLAAAAAVVADESRTAGEPGLAVEPTAAAFESTNIVTVAAAMVLAADARTESRGCHRRADHPEPSDAWLRHLDVRLDPDGSPRVA